jgi:hypothetical protein
VKLLTKFAERRQAQVNPSTLLTFADDLSSFPLGDIEAGLLSISSRRRAEGETAFPEIATVVDEVQAVGRIRRIAEARERRMADEAAERRHREQHPGRKLGDKFSFDRPKARAVPEPKMEACPHCSGLLPVTSNIRFWSAKELYEYAALKAESERIAEMNREANKLHAQKCIEEQLAHLPSTPVPAISEEVA